jgi:hypothetical protein
MKAAMNYPEFGRVAHGVHAGIYPAVVLPEISDMNAHIEQVFANAHKHEPRLTLEMVQDYFAAKHVGDEHLTHEVATLSHESFMLRATKDTPGQVRASMMQIMTASQISRGSMQFLMDILDETFQPVEVK